MKSRNGKWRLWDRETICDPETGEAYLDRIRIIETPYFNIFYHKILRSDWDRALHDHPWSFLSIILSGGYTEHTPDGQKFFPAGSVVKHRGSDLHRLELEKGKVARTLVLTGPKYKAWGFQAEDGWVHNEQYENAGG